MLKKLQTSMKDITQEFLYRYMHYDVETSVALIYSKTKNARGIIKLGIRDSDKFIQISKYLFVVFFQYTNSNKEVGLACKNLVKKINSAQKSKKTKAILAYTSFHEDDQIAETIINRLHVIFDEAVLKKEYIKSDEDFFQEYDKCHIDFKDI